MSFWRRLFSSDLRAAVAAEAAGKIELAAERYGLAGDRAGAVRMHRLRAQRAVDRAGELAALRDAMHWAGDDAALRAEPAGELGRALLAQAEAEGIATQRDRDRVREAAALLAEGGDHQRAGDALTKVGDLAAAAAAYSAGGLIDAMEQAMVAADAEADAERAVSHAWEAYQTLRAAGRRDDALVELRACAAGAQAARSYRRELDEFEAALITGGRVELRARGGAPIIACATPVVALGRDHLCDVPLRTHGVSRRHAEIVVGDVAPIFRLRDAGSRNGTRLGGVPVDGLLPLVGAGAFALGDDVDLEFTEASAPPSLTLAVSSGLDRGTRVVLGRAGERLPLPGLGADVIFVDGRPWLGAAGGALRVGELPVGDVRIQLIRGDLVEIDGTILDVA
ncbi:MAG: FHA domain-containing protein [Kofleriaceae bacterium]